MAHQALGQRQLGATTHCSGTGSSSRPLAPVVVARRQLRAGAALQQQQQQVQAVQQKQQQQLRSAVCAAASKLEDVPLFSDSSVVVKPAEGAAGSSSSSGQAAAGGVKLADVPLNSELGLDYAPLRDYLAEGDVRKADDETRALLIKMAGPGAVQRGWVYFTEVPPIPVADLQTVDALWRAASHNRFGYSVQREMWTQAAKRWPKFFKAINWVQGENNVYLKWPAEFVYSFDAAKGHMPLTNALRGTQLFQAIMEHPAFAAAGKGGSGASAMSIDDRSKAAGMDTLKF